LYSLPYRGRANMRMGEDQMTQRDPEVRSIDGESSSLSLGRNKDCNKEH
jgi:hypothetical protein